MARDIIYLDSNGIAQVRSVDADVVGTAESQALTNKTLTNPTINGAILPETTNIRYGALTLACNSGSNNVIIGNFSMRIAQNGVSNIAIGDCTLSTLSSAYYNIAIGNNAMQLSTSGGCNIAIGAESLCNNTTGCHNFSIGYESLKTNNSGNYNIGIGFKNSYANTTGCNNIALGCESLLCNSSGLSNIAIGQSALRASTISSKTIAIGVSALGTGANSCSNNIAIGENSATNVSYGSEIISIGTNSLYSNLQGCRNISIGNISLFCNTIGNNNISIGHGALCLNNVCSAGNNNIVIGHCASVEEARGYNNTIIGYCADSTTINEKNIAVACLSLNHHTRNAVVIGYRASAGVCGTIDSVVIGGDALFAKNGACLGLCQAVAIGANLVTPSGCSTGFNSVTIGYGLTPVTGRVILGTTSAYIYATPSSTTWTGSSDFRLKENIIPINYGLDFVLDLKPVKYNFKTDPNTTLEGFIAQDVEATMNKFGIEEFSGLVRPSETDEYYGFGQTALIPILVKAIQEQNDYIKKLEQRLTALEEK